MNNLTTIVNHQGLNYTFAPVKFNSVKEDVILVGGDEQRSLAFFKDDFCVGRFGDENVVSVVKELGGDVTITCRRK